MLVRIRTEARRGYIHATFHVGRDPMESSGALVLSEAEWGKLRKALFHGAPEAGLVIEETEMIERKVPG